MAEITGAQLVVDSLKREGIDTCYVLPGDPVGPIVNGIAEAGIKVISVRNEQAAAMAAQAHSYFTRSVGVCIAASGVAQTNTLTGIANAQANCWPLLVIAGSAELRRRNMGDFQEMAQVESTAPLSKWAYAVESIERIPTLINFALKTATAGRPGPVYLDLPAEMISGSVDDADVPIPEPAPEPARPLAEPQKIEQALQVLSEAENPLLIVGKGAAWSWAEDELRQFVDKTQIPFLTSPMGSGMLPPDHPMNVSSARTQALQGADTVLLVGARLNWIFHFGQPPRFAENYKLIQVDIEPAEIGTNHAAEVGLVGDAKMVMGQLVDGLDSNPVAYGETPWLAGLKEKAAQNAASIAPMLNSEAVPMGYYRILKEIRDYLPKDTMVVADGASTMDISRQVVDIWNPRHRIDAGIAGCVGTGVPFSLAAKVVYPDKPVVCLQGDWAFGFNGMDIETAARFNLAVVWVVFQNANIDKWVRTYVEGAEDPNDFKPDVRFDLMMEALGGHGEYVDKPDDLRPALERAFNSGKASLVNVIMNPGAGRREQQFAWLAREGRMGY
ncbi:MAG: thiamine pyrophosphate-binding protein [SAR202 cluster bacterium]|nr:thiamine pyrophosphate-binding protein [SAR202 cluster bacterium]|tara:strand:+ start:8075 stop:9742 length:1668 start_codon:yes stop_codon:yes gene_type:complete